MKKLKLFTFLAVLTILTVSKALACGPPSLEGPSLVAYGAQAQYYIDLSQVPNPSSYCIEVVWSGTGLGWTLVSPNGNLYAVFRNNSPLNYTTSGTVKATVTFYYQGCSVFVDSYNLERSVTLLHQ